MEVNKLYKVMNLTSFILSLVCVGLLFIYNISLILVFSLSFITIITGLIGFVGAATLGGKIRSVFTLIISVGLSLFIGIVLTLGKLFRFT